MTEKANGKERRAKYPVAAILILIILILIGAALLYKPAGEEQDNRTSQAAPQPHTAQIAAIEMVYDELAMLNSKDWSRLEAQLGRPRTTTLLWYHLKKTVGFEPKVVFGDPDKLNTSLAIPVKMGGDSTHPTIWIKGLEYYIIDPVAPAIIGDFDYGFVYEDPGSVPPGFFNDFRLNIDDIAVVEQWMKETGVSLSYTDLPAK